VSKTVRRKDWYPVVKGFVGKKCHRDASCKPGCRVCGKGKYGFDYEANRKSRRTWRQGLTAEY
jgi:hypothetical protein